jgi:hypothetical protein
LHARHHDRRDTAAKYSNDPLQTLTRATTSTLR